MDEPAFSADGEAFIEGAVEDLAAEPCKVFAHISCDGAGVKVGHDCMGERGIGGVEGEEAVGKIIDIAFDWEELPLAGAAELA